MLNTTDIVNGLKTEAKNPASNAVFHVFALRKRARNSITLVSLYHKMVKEGFNHPKSEYVSILKALAALGLGTLDTDSQGRVRGLKNVKMTLQSIGAAACGQTPNLSNFSARNRFMRVVPTPEVIKSKADKYVDVSLECAINGKSLKISIPKEFTADEITTLINKLHSA